MTGTQIRVEKPQPQTELATSNITKESGIETSPDSRPKAKQNDAATGASAAGVRALGARLVAFYFRAPVKAFFRPRVEYDKESEFEYESC